MDLTNAWEQLAALKDLTRRTGTLHEAQVLQLKLYPRLLFQSSVSSVFALDFATKKIVFTIEDGPKVKLKVGEVKIKDEDAPPALDEYVKRLLGDEWTVEVNVSKGKRKKKQSFYYPAVLSKKMLDPAPSFKMKVPNV